MLTELTDALVWVIRVALTAGLAWGAWLCLGPLFLPAQSREKKALAIEDFATFALLVLLVTTLGGALHPG